MPWAWILMAAAAVILLSELGWVWERWEWRRITRRRRNRATTGFRQASHVHIIGHHDGPINPRRHTR